jgi:hypothetical protein
MNDEEYWISAIVTAHAHKLVDPAYAHSLIALDAFRTDDTAQLPHDFNRFLAARRFDRLSNSRLFNGHHERSNREDASSTFIHLSFPVVEAKTNRLAPGVAPASAD